HKIAGMDLSKDTNVSKAKAVFKQIYTNKPLVKDMVWTKNFQDEMQRAEGFRNCIDPEKCGGQYWEDGVKFMQYKREEFKGATRDESMGFGDVKYVPYNNVVAKALDDFKEMGGFNMVTMEPSSDGKYKVTTKNGTQAIGPMTMLFQKLYQNNPQFHDMYKVMSYNNRKDWIYNAVASGDYNSLEEASVGFVENKRDELEKKFNSMSKDITHDYEQLKRKAEAYQEDFAEGRIQEKDARGKETEEFKRMQEVMDLYQSAEGLKSYNDMVARAQKGMHSLNTINGISDYLDEVQAQLMLGAEINSTAQLLAFKDYSVEYDADEYALLAQKHRNNVSLELMKFKHNQELQLLKNKDKEAEFRAQATVEAGNYSKIKNEALEYNPYFEALKKLKAMNTAAKSIELNPNITREGYNDFVAKIVPKTAHGELSGYLTETQREMEHLKINANASAIKAMDYYNRGMGDPEIDFDLFTTNLSPQQVNMVAQYSLDYPENAQLQRWAADILNDPTASKWLSGSEKSATESSTSTSTVLFSNRRTMSGGIRGMVQDFIMQPYTGSTTGVTPETSILEPLN
ncbi:MAG: hypothetical protein ACW98K_00005, partial [Candidatus Kariarchaeaceae archaeon]